TMFKLTEKRTIENLVTKEKWDLTRDASTWNRYHPLEVMALLAPEDFVIMQTDPETGVSSLKAGATAGWRMQDRIGHSLWQIHAGRVPQYEAKLAKSMDRFFMRMQVGSATTRFNYAIDDSDELFHPHSHHNLEADKKFFDSKVNNNNNWQKPDPAAINKLVQAHQLKATQVPQQAPVATSTLQHAEGGAIQDAAATDLPQPESAPTEAEHAQELPADVPPTLAEQSVPAAPTNLPASVAPVAASSEKLREGRQSGINNTSGNPSSTQLLYAMWEAQLTELKNKWLDQMKDNFQNLLGPFEPLQDHTPSSKGLDIDLDYQQWESAYRKENGQSQLDFSTDTITLEEAQDALRKLQAEKTAKKQMCNVLQMYARAEASFLEDTRAKFADFGSRALALHDGFVQNEAALKERVTRFMDA
ncbi:hypothetical protein KCU73_g8359, partial [Aureobasidium melanogenum]